ncbi:MAG: Muconolactone delta-isomerase [Actinomycetia bacterium]|nr:Muconolactone delta-isomerase [Actinomycetes bacterium]
MNFLVHIETSLPPTMPSDDRQALLDRELSRGIALREAGVITSIWRIPGRLANVGVWACQDADALHAAISSLPAWPWMNVTVTPLGSHPVMHPPAADSTVDLGSTLD